jgi:glycosyltransferase involved in cell wall biosynthesis
MKGNAPHQTITFAGKVAYGDVPALLAAHDIFLLASDYEGLPLSLLEAMGAGLVPVVSDLASGIRTVVTEERGIRVPIAQTEGYAAAIIRLHQQRDTLAAFSREAAMKVRQEYSIAAMTDRWLAALPAKGIAVNWPERFAIHPILVARKPWQFSPLGRVVRRSLLRLGWRG